MDNIGKFLIVVTLLAMESVYAFKFETEPDEGRFSFTKEMAKEEVGRQRENQKYAFTVVTNTQNPRIRILNIAPKYAPGMKLKNGQYHIEVSSPGYQSHNEWITIKGGELIFSVELEEQVPITDIVPTEPPRATKITAIPPPKFFSPNNESIADKYTEPIANKPEVLNTKEQDTIEISRNSSNNLPVSETTPEQDKLLSQGKSKLFLSEEVVEANWQVLGLIVGVIFIGLILAGTTNRVVVYYNFNDLIVSFMPWGTLLIMWVLLTSYQYEGDVDFDNLSALQTIILYGGITISSLFTIWAIRLSIKDNRSVIGGVFIGIFKIISALIGVVVILSKVGTMLDNKSTRQQFWLALIILFAFIWLGRKLINGESVYRDKGWTPR